MAKTKKEELTEGVDAPSVDNSATENDVVKEVTTVQEVESEIVEEATVEMVAKSLLDDALNEIERLKAVITDSDEEKESLKESLEQAYEVIEELSGSPVVEAEKIELLSFEFEGETYQFTEDAPAVILWNGAGVSQQQMIEDEDLLLQLIGSNSGLIIKK